MTRIDLRSNATRVAASVIILGLVLAGHAFGQLSSLPDQPSWTTNPLWKYFAYGPGNGQVNLNGTEPVYFQFLGTQSGTVADALGCEWNESYDSPPTWYEYNNGWGIVPVGSTVERGGGAMANMYYPAETFRGVQYLAEFSNGTYLDPGVSYSGYPPQGYFNQVGAMFYSSNKCFAGTTEYGFSYAYNYNPSGVSDPIGGIVGSYGEVIEFYFGINNNCPYDGSTLPNSPANGTMACFTGQPVAADYDLGCGAAVFFSLGPDSDTGFPNPWWYYQSWIFQNTAAPAPDTDDYQIAAQIVDPYDGKIVWQCVADPLDYPGTTSQPNPDPARRIPTWRSCSSVSGITSTITSTNYACLTQGTTNFQNFPTQQLYSQPPTAASYLDTGLVSNNVTDPWNGSGGTTALMVSHVYTGH